MENALLTRITEYGLNLMSNQIKSNTKRYILIGSSTYNDTDLLAVLDDNDLNNNITYADLNARKWIGYEGTVSQIYYDKDNFLTFEIRLPYEEELNLYVYGIGLIDTSGTVKRLISISRSPTIFNKVKYSSSLFSIKLTFNQENIDSQLRDNVYNSEFEDSQFLFKADVVENSNIIESQEVLSNIPVGTKLSFDGLPENTVVIDNKSTDNTLTINQLRLSKNSTKTKNDEAVFLIKTVFKQDDFVTKSEFNNWQKNHNHNNMYYKINETVINSSKLGGVDAKDYATLDDYGKLAEAIDKKLDKTGGYINGSLLSNLSKTTDFREEEFVPLFEIKKLIKDLKTYVDADFRKEVNETIDKIIGNLNSLNVVNKTNMVSALNELKSNIGNYSGLSNKKKTIVDSINDILSKIGLQDLDLYPNLIEAVNSLHNNKIGSTDAVFTNTPRTDEVLSLKDDTIEDNMLVSVGLLNQFMDTNKRTISLDLSNESNTMCYPVLFNESGLNHHTDSIIWNENYNSLPGTFRLYISGTGAANMLNAPYLHVANSLNGDLKPIKKIITTSTSSAIIVYLRGGINYKVELRGSDQNPKVITSSAGYTLQGSALNVKPESYNSYEYLDSGVWDFNGNTSITLDYQFNSYQAMDDLSRIGQIVYFPTNVIRYPYLPAVGQMLSKDTDSKLFAVIGNAGDPTGQYNTATQFKNLDLRDMVPVGISQGSLMPAQLFNATGLQNENTLTITGDVSGLSLGSQITAAGIPNNTTIKAINGNTITISSYLTNSISGSITQLRTIGSYQNGMYLANEKLNAEFKSIRLGLFTLYPAIRAQ